MTILILFAWIILYSLFWQDYNFENFVLKSCNLIFLIWQEYVGLIHIVIPSHMHIPCQILTKWMLVALCSPIKSFFWELRCKFYIALLLLFFLLKLPFFFFHFILLVLRLRLTALLIQIPQLLLLLNLIMGAYSVQRVHV